MVLLAHVVGGALLFGLWLWLIPCLYYAPLPGGELWTAAAAFFALAPIVALVFLPDRRRTLRVLAVVCVVLLAGWLFIPASNEGDWAADYARMPTAHFEGDLVTVRNVRNFEYRTESDFTPRYYDATYDLNELDTLDFIKVHWGLENIAHTMLSFGFRDGRYLTVSVETRRRKGQDWSSIAGFFKQYTLAYVLGDERDLIRLRTNYRGEDVYLYPTNTPKDQIRMLFVDILESATRLADDPQWYNTVTDNCTTSLARHIRKVRGRRRWDPRLLMNGHTDQMGIETGWITPHGTLEETRRFYYVNDKVDRIQDPTHYSAQIRAGLDAGTAEPASP
jgi:hypothetical protein